LTIFTLFFSDPVLTDLTDNTNAYAASKGAGTEEGSRHWVKNTPEELRIFLGIIFYMGVFRQNSVSEYWSTSPECPQHNITNFMSLVRFEQLKLFFSYLLSDKYYIPATNVSVDEMIARFFRKECSCRTHEG